MKSGMVYPEYMNREYAGAHYLSHAMRVQRQKERRQLQLKRRVCVLAALLAAVFAGTAFTAYGIRTRAAEENNAYKYYNSVTVQYGERLGDIADRYYDSRFYDSIEDYTRELCSINGIGYYCAEDCVRPGSSLIVAYYSEEFRQ